MKEAVEMQFYKINNFVNDYVKDWCYVQNIFKKNPKVMYKSPTVEYNKLWVNLTRYELL